MRTGSSAVVGIMLMVATTIATGIVEPAAAQQPQQPAAGDADTRTADNEAPPANDPLAEYRARRQVYNGPDVAARMQAGLQALRDGRDALAAREFLAAVALSDEHIVAMHFAGVAQFAAGQFVESAQMVKSALGLFPDWALIAFDITTEMGPTGPDRLAERTRALRETALASPNAADLWFLLGYVRYHTEHLQPAAEAFEMALQADPEDRFSQKYIDVLVRRGVRVKSAEPPRPEFSLPAGREWVVPGLVQLARNDFARAAVEFGSAGIRRFDDEPFVWMAIALIGDGQLETAAHMLVRGAPSTDPLMLAQLPLLADLLPASVIEAQRRAMQAQRPQTPGLRLIVGFLVFLEADLPVARGALEPLAAPGQAEGAEFLPAAVALLRALPARTNPPRLDLSKAIPVESTSSPPPANAGNGASPPPSQTGPPPNRPPETVPPQPRRPTAEVQAEIERLTRTGDDLLSTGDYQAACETYLRAHSIGVAQDRNWFADALRVGLFFKLARAEFALGDYSATRTHLSHYLSEITAEIRTQRQMFDIEFPDREFVRLAKRLSRHVDLNPTDADSRFVLAYLQFSAGEFTLAFENFTLLIASEAAPDPLAVYYLNVLRQPPYNIDRLDPAETAARHLRKGTEFIKEGLFETATFELELAHQAQATDAVVTALIAALWGQAAKPTRTPDDRIGFYRRIAELLRRHLLAQSRDRWRTIKLSVATVVSPDEFTRLKNSLAAHLRNKPLDFHAYYFKAFAHYFSSEFSDAVTEFENYQRMTNIPPSDEFEFFRTAAISGTRR